MHNVEVCGSGRVDIDAREEIDIVVSGSRS